MNSFFFGRQRTPDVPRPDAGETDAVAMAQAALDIQSITASAIFAMLVSKGVMTAEEAAAYMSDIAQVLARDVRHPVGRAAGDKLERFGAALVTAEQGGS